MSSGIVTEHMLVKGKQAILSAPEGTPPIDVVSQTKVANLNADLLDGEEGSDYHDASKLTGELADDRVPESAVTQYERALSISLDQLTGAAAGALPYAPDGDGWAALAPGPDGHVLTLAGGVPAWAPPSGGGGGVVGDAVRYTAPSAQPIPNGAMTIVNYATKIRDQNGAVTTGITWRYTATTAGWRTISAAVTFPSRVWAGESAILRAFVSGVDAATLDYSNATSSGAAVQRMLRGSTELYLAVGDTLDVRLYHNIGGTVSLLGDALYNYISITPTPGA